MAKGSGVAAGLGIISLLITVGVVMMLQKEEIKTALPATGGVEQKAMNEVAKMNLETAARAYAAAKGKAPEKAEDLVPEYINSIPAEANSHSNTIVAVYDGKGGWVYGNGEFAPNFPQ